MKKFSEEKRMGVRNSAFGLGKEARTQSSFCKFVQSADLSSEKMREIPQDVITELTSFTMVLRAVWGMSWEVELLKNPRFCYMEKRGWEKFVSDNALGANEFLTFTHEGDMSFRVHIFVQNGTEMIRPPLTMASFSRIKTEREDNGLSYLGSRTSEPTGGSKNKRRIKSEQEDDELMYRGTRTAEPTRGAKNKHKLNLGKKRDVKIDSAGPSSSAPRFITVIKPSHAQVITVPKPFAEENQLSKGDRVFKINHPNGKMSWKVQCVSRNLKYQHITSLSRGWRDLYNQYPIDIGDRCEFTLTSPTEMVLVASKAGEKTR